MFFASQLGKYLPGSVWPVLLQMEAGRARGASRRTMLAGNLITVVLSCATGLIVACLLLPISDAHALAPLLVGAAGAAAAARPAASARDDGAARPALPPRRPGAAGRAAARSRDRAGGRLGGAELARLGLQVWILYAAAGHASFSGWLLCTGGMALAVSAGILFIPAPAGAGLRELILVLVLKPDLGTGGALAIVVASRVLLVIADLALAAGGLLCGAMRSSRPRSNL